MTPYKRDTVARVMYNMPSGLVNKGCLMQEQKFTDEQKMEIALYLLSGRLLRGEVCRKYSISSNCSYKLKDRAMEIIRQGMSCLPRRSSAEVDSP